MSIFGMLKTATSGMGAQSNRLSTVADNIANASTAGYKRASTEFSSLILASGSGEYNSGSVETDIRYGIGQQGGFTFTTSATDLAVSGTGFLIVADSSDTGAAAHLTRAGSFVQDGEGYLINAAGKYLMGVPWSDPTPALPANGTSGLIPIQIETLALQAEPSALGTFNVNLPSTAATIAAGSLPSDNVVTSTYTAKSSLVAFDNLGAQVLLDVYAAKTTNANEWEITIYNQADADPTTVFPYANPALVTTLLTFDPTTGTLDLALPSPTSVSIPIPNGGTLVLDMADTTQLAGPYQVNEATVDGSAPSAVDRIEIDDTGTLFAIYQNGQRDKQFLIPLATVPSPNNLIPGPGNVFDVGGDSGDLLVGAPGGGGFGSIVPNALEKSTVDIASELTDMIEAQQSFTANSKVFQTGADLMEVIVNLRR
jgi:flagellar hook protein FlgE